jgi:hypothetical protein
MPWWEAVIPAILTALVIRIDALWLGPYFALSELVAGMQGLEGFALADRDLRWAFIRRFAYPGLASMALSLVDRTLTYGDAVVVGGLTAGLLIWPVAFHGLPRGVAPKDWWLAGIYGGLVAAFCAFAGFAHFAANFARTEGGGDVLKFLYEEGSRALIFLAVGATGSAFFGRGFTRVREQKREWEKTRDEKREREK